MAILDLPLVRDPRSQTQFLARLHLYLVAATSNAVCPPLAPQCTIDTSFDEARVLKLRAALFVELRASKGLWNLDTLCGLSITVQRCSCSGTWDSKRSVFLCQCRLLDFWCCQCVCFPRRRFCRTGCHEEQSAAADHVEFFPVVFRYPAAILREVHIASCFHHGSQRPGWPSLIQHSVIRREQKCIEMDKLAQEDLSYRLSRNEFERFQTQWYLTMNKSGKNAPMRL